MSKLICELALIMLGGAVFAQDLTMHHYEYVFPDGHIYVYDTDNHFALIKAVMVPTSAGTRGVVASAATGMLYISYGPDGCCNGSLLEYDLINDYVVWTRTYPFGIDSMAISPDGSTIYMPAGENNPGPYWEVIDAASGNVIGQIDSGGIGPHNTIVSASGTRLFMGPRESNYLVEADISTQQIIRQIGPITTSGGPGVRPFTINGAETLAFITATGLLGFQVADITSGNVLYNVPIAGFSADGSDVTAPSHGISISPDETELYLIDAPNSYVHVFDITGLPGLSPTQVADIPLQGQMNGSERGCGYDCTKDGWLHHSRDGRYVLVGDSGDVIDTATRTTVVNLPTLANTRKFIEIDFQNGVPVWAMGNRSSLGARGMLAVSPFTWVNVISKNSGKCLDITDVPQNGNGTQPATALQQWACRGTTNQQFQFVPVLGGYAITNNNSGLQLDVLGGPAAIQNGIRIIQYPYWGGSNEIWQPVPTSDGYFSIIPSNSGRCLDVEYDFGTLGATINGSPVQQWDCWGGDNQKWSLVAVP